MEWYMHRLKSKDIGPTRRPRYIPCSYIEILGECLPFLRDRPLDLTSQLDGAVDITPLMVSVMS